MKLNECVALNCKMTLTIMHTKCHQEFDNVLSQGSKEAENILFSLNILWKMLITKLHYYEPRPRQRPVCNNMY